jgi:hypothetical protein
MTTATVAVKPAKQPKPLPAPNSDFYEVWIGLRHAVLHAKPALGRRFCSFRIQND